MSLLDAATQALAGQVPGLPDLSSLLSSFASAFLQTTRSLKLHFAAASGIPANLILPQRLTGHTEINGAFRYVLDTLCSDVHVELKSLLGNPVELTLRTDAGTEQELCGIVTEVSQTGSEGGFATFRLVIESALSVLQHRVTARVFTKTNVRALTAQILGEHLERNAVLADCLVLEDRCSREYPEQPFWMQYNESDAAYLRRLWAREGISFVILPAEGSSADHPQHRLVLFDHVMDLDVNASATVRFHRADGTEQADAITQWHAHRVLQSGSVSRSAWDHASATVTTTSEASQADQGEYGNDLASTLDDYKCEPHLEEHGPESLAELAVRRVQVKEQRTQFFEGAGSVRTFQAGTWFTLSQHPNHTGEDRAFVLTRVDLEAVNNLPQDLQAGLASLLGAAGESNKPEPPYTNRFTCLRRGLPILPEELAPPIPGLLTARVVGTGQDDLHTDALGRIKLRFLFTREQEHADAGASETEADSAWVRQAEPWSSQGFGGTFIPRVGDEVVVQFLGDDPDKPVVLGSVQNGVNPPASFSKVSALPLDKALSGFRSQELGGTQGNELVLDDTTDELRARLASDHARSELNLGHLVHPRSGGVAEPRGTGFELRTDAYGAIRAEQGLLISTDGRTGAAGHHLDPHELLERTQATIGLTQVLSDASENHQAARLAVNEKTKDLKTVAEGTKAQVAAFQEALLALSSPAGIVEGTPGTIVKSTGRNLHLTSGQDTNLAVGRRLVMAIQEAWSVLAAAGIKLFAGKGDISIQAHEGSLELTAEKDVKLIACNQGIDLAAPDKAVLASGGCKVTLEGGRISLIAPISINCKAPIKFHLPDGKVYDMPSLAKVGEVYDHFFYMVDEDTAEPMPDVYFRLKLESGKVLTGYTDSQGQTCKLSARDAAQASVEFFPERTRPRN